MYHRNTGNTKELQIIEFEIGLVPFRTYKLEMNSIYPSDRSRLEVIIKNAPEAGRPKRQKERKGRNLLFRYVCSFSML